jgi:hypothetical protein
MKKRSKKSLNECIKLIRSARGLLKFSGQRPLAEWWPRYKAEEKELEEKKFQRLAALRDGNKQ